MKAKSIVLGVFLIILSAIPGFSTPVWTGPVNTVVRFWVGNYTEGDALVFDAADGHRYYFNLTGTELSRQMAASVMSAYYKAKKVDLHITDHEMAGNAGWKLVDALGASN
jgi:hypothetical protein